MCVYKLFFLPYPQRKLIWDCLLSKKSVTAVMIAQSRQAVNNSTDNMVTLALAMAL